MGECDETNAKAMQATFLHSFTSHHCYHSLFMESEFLAMGQLVTVIDGRLLVLNIRAIVQNDRL